MYICRAMIRNTALNAIFELNVILKGGTLVLCKKHFLHRVVERLEVIDSGF